MRKILIIISFFIITNCKSQQFVQGMLYNKTTKQPICYGTIFTYSSASITNSSGIFQIEIKENNNTDSIYIKCIGYCDTSYLMNDFLDKKGDTIFLTSKSYNISDITITAKKFRRTKLGNTKKKTNGCFHLKKASQMAMYIPNPSKETYVIQTIHFYVSDIGANKKQFRIKVLNSKKDSVYPNKNLLNEDIIIFGTFKNEWVIVDLSAHNIIIPDFGCFICVMPLQPSEEVLTIDYELNNKSKYFSSIGFNYNQKYVEKTWLSNVWGINKWAIYLDKKDVLEAAAMIYIETKKYD